MARENDERRSILKKSVLALAVASVAPSLFGFGAAQAASFTWDNNGATAPIAQDGPAPWKTPFPTSPEGPSIFAGNTPPTAGEVGVSDTPANGGVVLINAPITAGGITLNRSGYNLSGA